MIQGELFDQVKEFKIAVVIHVPGSSKRYPDPFVYINYYQSFHAFLAILRTEADLSNFHSIAQAKLAAEQRADIVVVCDHCASNAWPKILEQGGYSIIIGEVPCTSYAIPCTVKYLLDQSGNVISLHGSSEREFYDPLIALHRKGQVLSVHTKSCTN